MGKALIIDENVTMCKTLAGYLSSTFECRDFRSLERANDILKEQAFALIILESRFEPHQISPIIERLREFQPHAKIMLTLAAPKAAVISGLSKIRLDGILVKPLDAATVHERVQELFAVSAHPDGTVAEEAELKVGLFEKKTHAVISMAGKLVKSNYHRLKSVMQKLIARDVRRIVLNFKRVVEIDAHALRFLEECANQLKTLSGVLCFVSVAKALEMVLTSAALKMHSLFFEDLKAAEGKIAAGMGGMAYADMQRGG